MTLADRFIENVEPQLAALLAAVRRCERYLGPDDDWVEDDRRFVYEAADGVLRPLGRSTTSHVLVDDYAFSVAKTPDEVESLLHPKFQRNLLSTRKYRKHHDGGKQWADGSWVLDPADEPWQLHVILFESWTTGTDIYVHKESSVRNPSGHDGGDNLVHGDVDGILRDHLEDNDITLHERSDFQNN